MMSLTMSQLEAKKVEETIFINFIVLCFLEGCPTWGPRRGEEILLKVPKREIFVTELSTLSDPIWVGDLRNEPKN